MSTHDKFRGIPKWLLAIMLIISLLATWLRGKTTWVAWKATHGAIAATSTAQRSRVDAIDEGTRRTHR